MSGTMYLTRRYLSHNRGKALLMGLAVGLTLLLPASVTLLVERYNTELRGRAEATPLVLGSKGNRFDLVLQSLYFRSGRIETLPVVMVKELEARGDCEAIPLHVQYSAEGYPVVGTRIDDYLRFRGNGYASGGPPTLLGQAVIGSEVARVLGLGVGDLLTSDQANIYDISKAMPLKMPIAGVLVPTGSADDRAVFVSLQTTWVIAGLGHGHDITVHGDEARHAAAVTYALITPDNADRFHFHGDESTFPISSVIVLPKSTKAKTLITTRYNSGQRYQALEPAGVMDELMGLVLRVKRLMDANLLLVGLAMAVMLGLVVMLSLRLRAAERATLHRIGCGRWLIVKMQAAEVAAVLAGGALLAAGGAGLVLWLAPRLV
ncbi:MAG: hypothetical protein AAGC44_12620 [Planctomycetota bacterium]